MKKMFFLVMATLLLAGCASMQDTQSTQLSGNSDTKTMLATPEIYDKMSDNDRNKLAQLVATAEPKDTVVWKGAYVYEFASLGISINANGEPCRIYKLKATSTFSTKQMRAVACRINADEWQRKTHSQSVS